MNSIYLFLFVLCGFSGSSDDATDKSTATASLNGNSDGLEQTSFELCQQVSPFFNFPLIESFCKDLKQFS
jgi:hypothetical protein